MNIQNLFLSANIQALTFFLIKYYECFVMYVREIFLITKLATTKINNLLNSSAFFKEVKAHIIFCQLIQNQLTIINFYPFLILGINVFLLIC